MVFEGFFKLIFSYIFLCSSIVLMQETAKSLNWGEKQTESIFIDVLFPSLRHRNSVVQPLQPGDGGRRLHLGSRVGHAAVWRRALRPCGLVHGGGFSRRVRSAFAILFLLIGKGTHRELHSVFQITQWSGASLPSFRLLGSPAVCFDI